MSAAPKFLMINTGDLVESPLNPRKDFDESKLAELAASVAEKGVLEPLLVRPRASVQGEWEVAAGARRLRAAKAAKVATVPCLVREMSDTELLEVALLENVVRADISALEEGDAYRALVKEHGFTVEQLVEKTGKSRTVVFQRMKLAQLQGDARAALAAGKVSASVAELLARLPMAQAQEKALARLRKEAHYKFQDDEGDISRLPFRDARDILDEEFRLVLSKAPFDVKALDLVPYAGVCAACPKRTGADKDAFPDVKADTCLDAACWAKKTAAATRLLKAEVKEHGKELVKVGRISDQYDSDKLAPPLRAKYSKPTEKVDGKNTWKQLLGGLDGAAVVALDRENKTHQLVDKAKALELLEQKDPKKAAAVKKALETPTVDNWQLEQSKRREKEAVVRLVEAYVRRVGAPKVTKLETAVELLLGGLATDNWEWERVLTSVGLDPKLKLDKLKPAQRVQAVLGAAFSAARFEGRRALHATLAKLAKLDVKKLQKQAADAEKGTCFVCGCREEKACDGGCEWIDEGQKLCSACAEEE